MGIFGVFGLPVDNFGVGVANLWITLYSREGPLLRN